MICEKTAHFLSFTTKKTLLKKSRSKLHHKLERGRSKERLDVNAIDAAQPFDFEAKAKVVTDKKKSSQNRYCRFRKFWSVRSEKDYIKGSHCNCNFTRGLHRCR